ncbi:MAG: signal peptidase I [Rudaea sp.]
MRESPREAGLAADSLEYDRVIQDLIRGHLDKGVAVRFTVASGSMRPLLRPGDTIIVRAEPADRVRPGDVLLLRAPDGWLVHRLVDRRKSSGETVFITKGDNTPVADEEWRPGTQVAVATGVALPSLSLDLMSLRARLLGGSIAGLSRMQGRAFGWRPGPRRSAALTLLDRAIYLCDRLIRWN